MSSLLPDSDREKTRSRVFSVLMMTFVVNAIDRQMLSIVASAVQRDLAMASDSLRLVAVSLYVGGGLVALPAAWLLRPRARKSAAVAGLLLASLTICASAYVQSTVPFLVLRFFTGAAIVVNLVACISMAMANFPRRPGRIAAILAFSFGIGSILGPNLGGILLDTHGWRMVYLVFGMASLPVALLFVWLVPSGFAAKADNATQLINQPGPRGSADASSQASTRLLAVATALLSLSVFSYLSGYVGFLRDNHAFTWRMGHVAVSVYGFGALLALYGGRLGESLGPRRVAAWAFALVALIGGMLFGGPFDSLAAHILLSALFGAAVSGLAYGNLLASLILAAPTSPTRAVGLFLACFFLAMPLGVYGFELLRAMVGWSGAGLTLVSVPALVGGGLCVMASRGNPSR